jgi:hypothetical protein
MLEDTKPQEKIDKIVEKTNTDDKFIAKRDSKKTLRQIAFESKERVNKAKEEIVKEQDKIPDVKPVIKKEEKKIEKKEEKKPEAPVIDVEKIKEEAIKVGKETAKKEFEAKTKEIMDKQVSDEQKQKEADELISVWDKEKRLPKDYKEVVIETHRLAKAQMEKTLRERDAKAKAESDARTKEAEDKRTTEQKTYQARVDAINTKVKNEMNELYEGKFLKKPPEKYDEGDSTQKETDELMKFGIDLNVKRTKEGLPPIDSISKIYFMHYKPYVEAQGKAKSKQPAGENAPISGAKSTDDKGQTKGYVYARDHKKSYRQILQENMSRQKKV